MVETFDVFASSDFTMDGSPPGTRVVLNSWEAFVDQTKRNRYQRHILEEAFVEILMRPSRRILEVFRTAKLRHQVMAQNSSSLQRLLSLHRAAGLEPLLSTTGKANNFPEASATHHFVDDVSRMANSCDGERIFRTESGY